MQKVRFNLGFTNCNSCGKIGSVEEMKALDLAISLLDAEFTKGQLNKHYREHKKEFKGLTKEQYANRAKEASEREPLKGEVKYSRKDGSKALYNLKTGEFTVWYPANNTVATHFKPKFDKKSKKQNMKASREYVRKDMKENGLKPSF